MKCLTKEKQKSLTTNECLLTNNTFNDSLAKCLNNCRFNGKTDENFESKITINYNLIEILEIKSNIKKLIKQKYKAI